MDAYNRGYGAGIKFGNESGNNSIDDSGIKVGTAIILDNSTDVLGSGIDSAIGFYALAYSYNGETIISYRGTDNPVPFTYGSDFNNGWPLSLGGSVQGQMAIDFYNEVVNVTSTSITLTGHSLGGGLAGFVAAISDQPQAVQALIFDPMDYEAAAAFTVGNYDDSGISAYHIEGEFLSGMIPFSPTDPSIIVDIDIGDKSNLNPFDLHSQATLIIGLYGKTMPNAANVDWKAASLYMWDVLYNDGFADLIGYNTLAGTSASAVKLRGAIAYSAIDEGTLVFGDTGIRSLYDDANDLGAAILASRGSLAISLFETNYATDISKVFVQFAGQLALGEIDEATYGNIGVLDGVLTYDPTSTDNALMVNFDDALWTVIGTSAVVARDTLIGSILENTSSEASLRATLQAEWGDGSNHIFDRVVFSVNQSEDIIIADKPVPTSKATLFVGGNGINNVTGSSGKDLILGGDGDDLIIGSYGGDIIDGGAHDVKGDSIDYGILDVNNVIHVNLGSSSVTALDWTGNSSVTISGQTADIFYSTGQLAASDLITNIENIYDTAYSDVIVGDNYDNGFYHSGGNDSYHGGDGDDSFYINGLDQNYTIRVAGGAGDDTLYLGGKASDWETPFNNEGTNITTYVHKASGTKVNAIDFESVSAEGTIYINGSQSAVHKQAGGVFDINGIPPNGANGSNGANDPYIDVSRDSANRETTIDISYINENGDLIGITCINFWGGGEEVKDATVYINGIPSVWMNSNGYAFYLPEFGEIDGLKPVEGISDTITSFGNDDLFGSTVLFNDPSTNFYTTTYHGVTASDVMGVYALLDQAESTGSPLILDLGFDGVELVSLANSSIYWDIDQDGFAEHSGWVSADDGLLAIDSNSDGKINSHSELFGSVSGDGFTALSVYDTNSDGVIDVNDEQFGDLLIWRDLNQNGISGAEELFTLADFDIVSIDLNTSTPYNMFLEGHNISHVSSYTVDDGVNAAHTHDIVDAWFQYDDMNTLYNQSFDLDLHTLDLPNFRGYGTLPTL